MKEITKLLTPIKIGNMEVKNRVLLSAMHMNYTPNGGEVTDQLIEFYAERARNGVGLIIVGGCTIDDVGAGVLMIGLHDDRYIPGLKRLTDACHVHGAKIGAQLYHAGRYAWSFLNEGRQSISSSAIASKFTGEIPREMTKEDIQKTRKALADGALRAKKSGFDTVEILGSAGYLICQFLSPLTNKRTDEYGGSLENRMRFGLEVIAEIRAAVGRDYPLVMRVAGNDFMPGSNTNKETVLVCKEYEKAGIDLISVTGGWHETLVPQLPMVVPRGTYTYLANNIKKEVNVPVVAANRINDPYFAEKVLRDGIADMVVMARSLIADPELIRKVESGETDRIRPCVACNQGCFDMVFAGQPITCLMNYLAGREWEVKLEPAKQKKKVLVIGAGPGGLEAARVAKMRGHDVVVWEKGDEIGGQLLTACGVPFKADFRRTIDYFAAEMKHLGIKVKLGRKASKAKILKQAPDVVVVATGAKPLVPNIPGLKGKNVYTSWEVLNGEADLGKKIVVIGGGAVGCETALCVAEIGCIEPEVTHFLLSYEAENIDTIKNMVLHGNKEVTIIEMLPRIGQDIGKSTRWVTLQELKLRGIKNITSAKVTKVAKDGLKYEQDGVEHFLPADTIVNATGAVSDNALHAELKDSVKELYILGDAVKPRKAMDAIHEGFQTGLKI